VTFLRVAEQTEERITLEVVHHDATPGAEHDETVAELVVSVSDVLARIEGTE
jgi:hypothetical protein